MIGTKIAILETSLNTQEYSSLRLPTQGMVYPQTCFRQSIALTNFHHSPQFTVQEPFIERLTYRLITQILYIYIYMTQLLGMCCIEYCTFSILTNVAVIIFRVEDPGGGFDSSYIVGNVSGVQLWLDETEEWSAIRWGTTMWLLKMFQWPHA